MISEVVKCKKVSGSQHVILAYNSRKTNNLADLLEARKSAIGDINRSGYIPKPGRSEEVINARL